MEEKARFAVGLDIGTSTTRAVMGTIGRDGKISVVGYGEVPSEGLRRGIVKELMSPPRVVDTCLRAVEGMSGLEVNDATVNINGSHIGSTKVDGMIAVGVADHEITDEDINRIAEASIAGKIPANREILSLVPYEYVLDGQGGIKEPFGMHGARLELRANVISALSPDCENIHKACEAGNLRVRALEPSVVAASRVIVTNAQK